MSTTLRHRHVPATALADMLGVDIGTLLRWHAHGLGPRPSNGHAALCYSRPGIEAWLNRLGSSSTVMLPPFVG